MERGFRPAASRALRICLALLLPALLPLAGAAPAQAQATIRVDWHNLSAGHTRQSLFGTNDEMCGQFSDGALDPAYASRMAYIHIGFIRLHSDTVHSWTTNGAWDKDKIATELNAPYVRQCGGGHTLITINEPPQWCRNADGSINVGSYAKFCAQLVWIVNKELGKGVRYWECMNEPDLWKDFRNNQSGIFPLYNACADAMKAVDPTIKVGGPTLSWYQAPLVDRFLTNCWANVDFLSWHHYMTCSSGTDIQGVVMAHIGDFTKEIDQAHRAIASHRAGGFSDGHRIQCAVDEFNIPCDWRNQGWGQGTNIGAAFFAAVFRAMALAHLDISANWSAKEDNYGMIDMSDHIRPPGYVYAWANRYLVGKIAEASSDDPSCEVLPIYRGAGAPGDKHALLLFNTSAQAKSVTLSYGLPAGQVAHVSLIDATGMHPKPDRRLDTPDPVFQMPAYSVALIRVP